MNGKKQNAMYIFEIRCVFVECESVFLCYNKKKTETHTEYEGYTALSV